MLPVLCPPARPTSRHWTTERSIFEERQDLWEIHIPSKQRNSVERRCLFSNQPLYPGTLASIKFGKSAVTEYWRLYNLGICTVAHYMLSVIERLAEFKFEQISENLPNHQNNYLKKPHQSFSTIRYSSKTVLMAGKPSLVLMRSGCYFTEAISTNSLFCSGALG